MRRNKGITLIALVVTVVVLLILASITIGTLTGKNGTIKKAQEAKREQEISEEREIVELSAVQAAEKDKFGNVEKDNLNQALTENIGAGKYELKEDKTKFTIIFKGSDSKTEHYIWKDIPILTNNNVKFTYDPSTWTNQDVTVTVETTIEGYIIQTSKNGKDWSSTNKQVYSENGTVYVRLANENGQTNNLNNKFTGNVTNIDKTKPIITSATATTNSIKLTSTDEASGIVGYTATKSNTEPTNFTKCTSTKTLNATIPNVKQNTTYYVWVKDQAGNVSVAKTIKTQKVPDLTTANVKFTYNPSTWTNKDVVATAKATVGGYTLQTSKDNKTWTTTNNQTFTANGTIYARLIDSTNQTGGVATGNVTNIDKTKPIVTSATTTTNSIKITATDEASGIVGYTVTTNNTTPSSFTGCTNTKTLNVTVGNKTQNTTYYVWVKDQAGNISVAKTAKTQKVPDLTTANVSFTYSPSGWTNGNVTATASTTASGYTIETSTDNKAWTATNKQTRSNNGAVYVRLKDSTGQVGGVATGNVTNIDKTAPNATISLSGAGTVTSNPTIYATVNHTDDVSGVKTRKYVLNTSGGAIGTNESSYTGTFNGNNQQVGMALSSIGNYYIHVLTIDNAGNKKETISQQIRLNANRHVHTGNSNSGGGCYSVPIKHTHVSACYTVTQRTGIIHSHTTSWGDGTWDCRYECSTCGTMVGREGLNPDGSPTKWGITETGGTHHCTPINKLTCGKSDGAIDHYELGCNISTEQILSYEISY